MLCQGFLLHWSSQTETASNSVILLKCMWSQRPCFHKVWLSWRTNFWKHVVNLLRTFLTYTFSIIFFRKRALIWITFHFYKWLISNLKVIDISKSYDYGTKEASQLPYKEKNMTCKRIISECIKKTSRLRVILEHGGFVEAEFMVMEVCGGLKLPEFLVRTSQTSIPIRCIFKKIQILRLSKFKKTLSII